jgi:glycosyltransferase involved in cell wall biosynthesis
MDGPAIMTADRSMPAGLTIVAPVYNEAAALPAFLAALLPFAAALPAEVILVDDGSRDGSSDILAQAQGGRVRVLRHKLNRGYGGALKTGVAAARTRYTITMDADGQHSLDDVRRLYETICRTEADMVIGSRRGQKDASLTRAIGKRLIRLLAKSLMSIPVHDLNSGMKIVETRMAQQVLHLCPDTMAYSDTIALLFINLRCLVIEEPIQVRERQGRASTIGLRDAFATVRAIINMVMLFHPLNLFLPAAITLAALGLTWTARCYLINHVLSQGAAVLLLSALFTLLLGLLAEQLADLRRTQGPRPLPDGGRDPR